MPYSLQHAITRLKSHDQAIRVRDQWTTSQPYAALNYTDLARDIHYAELALSNAPSTHPQHRELSLRVELARGELKNHPPATRGR